MQNIRTRGFVLSTKQQYEIHDKYKIASLEITFF